MTGRPGRAAPAGRAGLIAIGASVAGTFAVAVAGPSVMEPALPGRPGQPPWSFGLHPSPYLAVGLTAAALAAGTLGLVLVLRAVRGGWSVPARAVLVAGLLAAAALTLVPPFGSSDHLSYAAYGRMLVTGHNPYTTTPAQLAALGDPVARAVQDWSRSPSVYGPLATAIQALASLAGGTSVRLTVFVLGLANLAAFAGTALLLHRMTRRHPVWQLRAALLWAANPLLLQVLVAGAHVDSQAVVFGVAAVAVMSGQWRVLAGAGSPPKSGGVLGVVPPAAERLAGVLVGLGFAVKVTIALVGLGLALAVVLRARARGSRGGASAAAVAAAGGPRRRVRGDGGHGGGHRRVRHAAAVVPGERHGVDRVPVAGDPDDHSPGRDRDGRDRHGEGRGGRAGRGARGAADPRAGPGAAGSRGGLRRGGLRAGAGLAVRLALRAAVVRRAGLGAAPAGPAGAGRRRGGARLDLAGQDRGARVRLPAGPAGRRGAAARARLAAAGDQARGDARGARRGHGVAGVLDVAGAAVERRTRPVPRGPAARGEPRRDPGEGAETTGPER